MVLEDETVRTDSAEETRLIGRRIGWDLQPGRAVLLRGEIGAGKSVLAEGIADVIGVEEWQGSPTFTLVNEYDTEPVLYHIDLYRLESGEIESVGLEEYARPNSIMVVEWADRAPVYLSSLSQEPPLWIDVMAHGDGPRTIVIHAPTRGEPVFGTLRGTS